MDKKTFALNAIKRYAKDPTLCGIDPQTDLCANITPEGNMCVAGQYLLPEVREKYPQIGIQSILLQNGNNQYNVFIPEAVGILNDKEWKYLQSIHDRIAMGKPLPQIEEATTLLGLFTYEEMMA